MELSSERTNGASVVGPDFTSDDLSLIIGTCLPEAVALLDPADGKLLGGNRRLEELLGISIQSLNSHVMFLDGFVHPEDLSLFRMCRTSDLSAQDTSIELRLGAAAGDYFHAEVHLLNFRWKRQSYLLAFIHPFNKSSVEVELTAKIAEQKKKTLEAVKSSLLIYQFTEKIKKTPVLTTSLLSTNKETQLFEQAARILTSDGLNYKDVTFLLVDGNSLEVCYSTKPVHRKIYPLDEENRYSWILNEQNEGVETLDREILVSLRSRGTVLGLVEVTLHPRERIFFDELNLVSEWHKDALLTIGDMIALLLDNLRLYRQVKRQSIIDPLTGVYNRHYFTDRMSVEIRRCIRNDLPISMIFIDVDHFKEINDTYGHLVGDQILQELGSILKNNLRGYDFLCRYGGDEFIVLLPEVDGERVQTIATKLLEVMRRHKFRLSDDPSHNIVLSISLGVSVLNKEQDEDEFLKSVDQALYKAKKLGRNRLVVYNASSDNSAENKSVQTIHDESS